MLYKYLINGMETMLVKEIMMDYVRVCLMEEMLKCREKDPNVRILPWCCHKIKATTHFRTKVQNRISMVANRATLCGFARKLRTTR